METPEITRLLARHAAGDAAALDELMPVVYGELRKLARSQRRRMGGDSSTLDTTALAHEAYLRLAKSDASFEHRGHFYAVMAAAMRQLLVDEARRRSRAKRGGGVRPAALSGDEAAAENRVETILAVDQALERLASVAPRLRSVVECRFFLGLDEIETATALGVTDRTVRRDWLKARALLGVDLGRSGSDSSD